MNRKIFGIQVAISKQRFKLRVHVVYSFVEQVCLLIICFNVPIRFFAVVFQRMIGPDYTIDKSSNRSRIELENFSCFNKWRSKSSYYSNRILPFHCLLPSQRQIQEIVDFTFQSSSSAVTR